MRPPIIQVREKLHEYRAQGRPFDLAWNHAIREIEWTGRHSAKVDWLEVLADTRDEFEAAYYRRPTRVSEALRQAHPDGQERDVAGAFPRGPNIPGVLLGDAT